MAGPIDVLLAPADWKKRDNRTPPHLLPVLPRLRVGAHMPQHVYDPSTKPRLGRSYRWWRRHGAKIAYRKEAKR